MNERLKSTSILKGMAIILIILNHVSWSDRIDLRQFAFWVYQNVPIFAIITGFHYTASIKKLNSCFDWYEKKRFAKKTGRILMPYSVMSIISMTGYAILGNHLSLKTALKQYFIGGVGQEDTTHWSYSRYLLFFQYYIT